MTAPRHRRRVGGQWLLVCWLVASGCTLSNSLTNARRATSRGDALLARGLPDSAAYWFGLGATSAERLVAREPDSPAAHAARRLAGRAIARAADVNVESCGRAHAYLSQFLLAPSIPPRDRWDAELAKAICEVRTAMSPRAANRLAVLTATSNSGVPSALVHDVRRWHARALLAAGDAAGADRVLRSLNATEARWDRVDAAWTARDWPRAESLLVSAASVSDWRPIVAPLLVAAWADGAHVPVAHIVQEYDASRIARRDRARLQLVLADAARSTGDTARARAAYERVLSAYVDDAVSRSDAWVGQLQLSLSTMRGRLASETAQRLRDLVFEAAPRVRQHPRFHAVASSVALYLVLSTTEDPSGAAGYLAGEVARDSLRAPLLAVDVWQSVANLPGAPLAARAVYATWLLADRSPAIRDTLLTRFPESPMADVLRGDGVRDMDTHRSQDGLLEGRWLIATRARDDSLRAWHARGVLARIDSLGSSSPDRSSSR